MWLYTPNFGGSVHLNVCEIMDSFPMILPDGIDSTVMDPPLRVDDGSNKWCREGQPTINMFWKNNVKRLSLTVVSSSFSPSFLNGTEHTPDEYDSHDSDSFLSHTKKGQTLMDAMVGNSVTTLRLRINSSDVFVKTHHPSLHHVTIEGYGTYPHGLLYNNLHIQTLFLRINRMHVIQSFVEDLSPSDIFTPSSSASLHTLSLLIHPYPQGNFLHMDDNNIGRETQVPLPMAVPSLPSLPYLRTVHLYIAQHRWALDLQPLLNNQKNIECIHLNTVFPWDHPFEGGKRILAPICQSLKHVKLQGGLFNSPRSSRKTLRNVMELCEMCPNIQQITLILNCHPPRVRICPCITTEISAEKLPHIAFRISKPSELLIGSCQHHSITSCPFSSDSHPDLERKKPVVHFTRTPKAEQWKRYSLYVPYVLPQKESSNEMDKENPYGGDIVIP
jgi:hypothetical protein